VFAVEGVQAMLRTASIKALNQPTPVFCEVCR
jgi:hypothetical protein